MANRIVNGELVEMTLDEEAAFEAERTVPFDREVAARRIDDACRSAIAVRLPFLEEYKQREAQAQAFKDGGYSGDAPARVSEFAVPAGLSSQAATDLVLQQAAQMRADFASVAGLRMRKYEVLRAADDQVAKAALEDVLEQLVPIAARLA